LDSAHQFLREGVLRLPVDENHAREQADQFGRNAVELISHAELAAKLADGRPLRIKLGMDPTAPDLHLGHSIALKKLRDFQRAGHTVIFLVGDFTATIGDLRSEPLNRSFDSCFFDVLIGDRRSSEFSIQCFVEKDYHHNAGLDGDPEERLCSRPIPLR